MWPAALTVTGACGSQAGDGLNIYLPLTSLQQATGHPGMINTLLIRAARRSHPAIDALAARRESTLARAGTPPAHR